MAITKQTTKRVEQTEVSVELHEDANVKEDEVIIADGLAREIRSVVSRILETSARSELIKSLKVVYTIEDN